MGYARKEIYNSEEPGVYHCVSRCVRQGFLCGNDNVTGNCYEHRRGWIQNRLKELGTIFAVEVFSFAIMNNHLHIEIRNRPDIAAQWSPEEVIRRWLELHPRIKMRANNLEAITEMTNNTKLVELYRKRLSCISWFNKELNEHIARKANKEDDVKGRFWEGRFWCQRLLCPGSTISCSVYIDLNPIRAGIATTLEDSNHTSIQQRIQASQDDTINKDNNVPLASIATVSEETLTETEYFELVDATGRIHVEGKASIPDNVIPILKKLKINEESWHSTSKNFRKLFKRIAGPVNLIEIAKHRAQKSWFQGTKLAESVFST